MLFGVSGLIGRSLSWVSSQPWSVWMPYVVPSRRHGKRSQQAPEGEEIQLIRWVLSFEGFFYARCRGDPPDKENYKGVRATTDN
mmetsp:Transcript_31463/g.33810  ORF Transcript_31463/g.33810 Transcript_31463/m.33810 type:complete len:84 (+) Transcript_31463:726-977(+)